MNYVIGSGPAGVAAAVALLGRGLEVTMLDAGGELEPHIQAAVTRAAERRPEQWSESELNALKGRLRYNSEGAPLKLAFGSDYAYRDVDTLQPVAGGGVDAYRALAAGGMSVLWGAALLPFAARDFDQWPVDAEAMRPHYVDALRLTGLTGTRDRLAGEYPLLVEPSPLNLSSQAQFVLDTASRHAAELEREQLLVGQGRLAIVQPSAAGHSCAYCGMCLYGCPYGLIYSSAHTLRTRLLPDAGFTYIPGVIVRRLQETRQGVVVEAESRDTQRPRRFEGSRVYVAAGVLGSTAIVLASRQRQAAVTLRQSEHFLLPALLRRRVGRMAGERLHTLSQLFIELLDPAVSARGIHLQLYTYSDFYPRMARDKLGPLYPMVAPVVERAIDRLVVLKGYLHSDESTAISASLDEGGGRAVLRLEPVASASRPVIGKAAAKIARNGRRLGLYPVRAGLRVGRPGSGVHVGGSFPMRLRPGALDADAVGRPAGFERVHVVDASVFPTMPAAPPTLTIMANALRIATEAQRLDRT